MYVPHVHWKLTSKRVLTAEWIDGCKSSDRESIQRMGLSLADVSVCVWGGSGWCECVCVGVCVCEGCVGEHPFIFLCIRSMCVAGIV